MIRLRSTRAADQVEQACESVGAVELARAEPLGVDDDLARRVHAAPGQDPQPRQNRRREARRPGRVEAEHAPRVQFTRNGVNAFADTVATIARETGRSVEHVALSLRELHESGRAVIDEDGKVTVLRDGSGPEHGDTGVSEAFAEAVRASVGAAGRARGPS